MSSDAAAPLLGTVDRLLTLRPYELLIFAILFVLLGLCLAAAPLIVAAGVTSPDALPSASAFEGS
jgi:hypothetical protein